MVTIYDIARRVGCAPSTVSRALGGAYGVREKTKKEILLAAKEMNYVPDSTAKNLKSKRSWNIGVIMYVEGLSGLKHYLFAEILDSFANVVESHNYDITLFSKNIVLSKKSLFDNFLDIVAEGLNKLEEKGYTPVIRGMWWMQGEAEANTKTYADAYYELLTDLISDLRSDLTQVTGQDCSSMSFVIGKIYRNPAYSAMSQIETIRAAQEQAAQTLVNVATVDCTGLAQQDGWHFTADAQLYLGEQFVQKVTGMDGKYWVSCASDYIDFSGGGAKQHGETVTITVSARRGYRIEDVTMQIGMQEPVSVTLTNGRYTFVMPESNVSFTVNAQALELYQLTKYESNDASMGSIYPSAEASAGWYEGEQVQIFVRPAEGYTVARATVNGTEIAAVGEQNDGLVYELNVAADVEFYVEFASEQTQPAPPEEPSDETPENNPNTGLWVGIGVGGAVIVAAALVLVVIFVRKRK